VSVNTFIILQKKYHSFHKHIKQHIDNNKKCFWAANQHIRIWRIMWHWRLE